MPELSVDEIARLVGGSVVGDGARRIRGVAPLETAGSDDLTFVANPRYTSYVQTTGAAAVLISESIETDVPPAIVGIRVADPYAALARILPRLYPEKPVAAGIHETAIVDPHAELDDGVSIGPHAVIERGVRIGRGSRIGASTFVGAGSRVGADCVLHPHVTLYERVVVGDRCIVHSGARLGADGFGYAFEDGVHHKVPQVGGCRIGDDVEIGANATIDRGSLGETVVGNGTKIDNLVHIGHNCRVGNHVLIIAQVGVSGSCVIGDGAVLAGQAGIAGHLRVGARARVGAQAGVIGDVDPGETVSGYPARPHREAMRAQAALFRLPRLLRRLENLERKVFGESSG